MNSLKIGYTCVYFWDEIIILVFCSVEQSRDFHFSFLDICYGFKLVWLMIWCEKNQSCSIFYRPVHVGYYKNKSLWTPIVRWCPPEPKTFEIVPWCFFPLVGWLPLCDGANIGPLWLSGLLYVSVMLLDFNRSVLSWTQFLPYKMEAIILCPLLQWALNKITHSIF